MWKIEFGFTEIWHGSVFIECSPLGWGHITVSRQDEHATEVTTRYEMMWIVLDLLELMSGLRDFFSNPRTKHYSFIATEGGCHIQIDRRKHSMVLLQIKEVKGLHPETEVLHAFREGLIHFMNEAYPLIDLDSLEKNAQSNSERALDGDFRREYQDFMAWCNR